MKKALSYIVLAILVLAIVIGFRTFDLNNLNTIWFPLLFAGIIILANVFGKEIVARNLDCSVKHEIWMWSRYGYRPHWHLKKEIPFGIIIPLFFTVFSLGAAKVMTLLSYDTAALKRRAAKRHGFYSWTEVTDWHHALVGGGGIIAVLLVSIISYFIPGLEPLPRLAAVYAFWNLLPISSLDGTHILFGSKPFWITIAVITVIILAFSFIIV